MTRYMVQLFGVTVFCLSLIWFVGSGEASQSSGADESILWADTTHIYPEGSTEETEPSPRERKESFLKDVKKLTHVAFNVRNQYMEEVDTEEIIKAGIRGMLSDLDRFSVLMERSAYDDLMESTHGKYEGLGMQIDARDDHIVIVAPIEGTPAYRKGLRAGDVIWEIDGTPTEGMTASDGSKLMRGKAGTSVVLTIKRTGIAELLEFDCERAVIELKSVNYFGVVPGTNIGYVRLSRFAQETSHELREAIGSLDSMNISGLIFDLRSNGGGLLDQAKETSELFLKSGSEIVYTRGKHEHTERHYLSERPPLYSPDKPLIILVDQGTASASEIVSGAIQDWDRGLIVGSPTYGKGLVQQIFPISQDGNMQLKLTTAKYYVPSGRCIQKPETQAKRGHEPDVEDSGDSLEVADRDIFYTNGGRVVYGGGGILPDVEVDRDTWKPIEINLERKSMFFDYAVQYVADHPDVKPGMKITDEIIAEFKTFIEEKEFDYKTSLQVALEDLEEAIDHEDRDISFDSALASVGNLIEQEKARDFERSIDYIKRNIRRDIVSSIAGERGVYENIVLKTDKAVLKAVEILSSPDEYTRLMSEGQTKKAELN